MLPVLPKTQLGCSPGRQIPSIKSCFCASGVCYINLPCCSHSIGLQAWLYHRPTIYYTLVCNSVKPVATRPDCRLAKETADAASNILLAPF